MTYPATEAAALPETSPAAASEAVVTATVARLRTTFDTGRTRDIAWRKAQLAALEQLLHDREAELLAAVAQDMGRQATEGWLTELAPVATEARYARKHLQRWMRRTRVGIPLSAFPAGAWFEYEPLGVTLIIGPWNYPVFLSLAPLVGALAAGNCAIIKPSEHTPTVSATLARLVPEYLDPDAVAVIEGAAQQTQQLLSHGLDHVFFTGGPAIGKAVMTAAAPHLTPVTLELGGKSPAIVTAETTVRTAARRIAWAKLMNSGQTCIAPDYVLVDARVRDEFVEQFTTAVTAFTAGRDALLPLVHTRHAERVRTLLTDCGGEIVHGGAVDVDGARAEMTVVLDPPMDDAIMTEEIFAPILPIITIDSLDAAISHIKRGPKPLAVYLFSTRRNSQRRVRTEISNGGTVINHLMYQVVVPQLPFGGVGNSGMGTYHGKWGFETFSHRKSVVRKPTWPDPDLLYPPYTGFKRWLLRRVF